MSTHLDFAEESVLEAWRGASTDPSTIEALTRGGHELVRAARELEQLGAVVEELRREVARLSGADATPGSVTVDRVLNDVRDVRILATAECGRCGGEGQVYDPDGFGWKDILAQAASDTLRARARARVQARMEELGLDQEPPEEGPCRDCGGRRRIEVSLTAAEYEALHRPPAGAGATGARHGAAPHARPPRAARGAVAAPEHP